MEVLPNDASKMPKTIIYCDGAATQSTGAGSAALYIIQRDSPDGVENIEKHSRFYAATTNNIMEYMSLIACFKWIARQKKYSLVIMDAMLVLQQIRVKSDERDTERVARETVALYAIIVGFVVLAP